MNRNPRKRQLFGIWNSLSFTLSQDTGQREDSADSFSNSFLLLEPTFPVCPFVSIFFTYKGNLCQAPQYFPKTVALPNISSMLWSWLTKSGQSHYKGFLPGAHESRLWTVWVCAVCVAAQIECTPIRSVSGSIWLRLCLSWQAGPVVLLIDPTSVLWSCVCRCIKHQHTFILYLCCLCALHS